MSIPLNQYFAAIRIDEKYVWTAELENAAVQRGDWGGFSGSIFTDSGGAIAFNLYTDPKEDVSIGVRHIPMAVPVLGAAAFYMKELIQYPPQFKVGFLSNNPPVYDLLPKMQDFSSRTWRRTDQEDQRRRKTSVRKNDGGSLARSDPVRNWALF